MSKAQQRRHFNNADEHQQEILAILNTLGRSRGMERVWNDWIEICAIALARLDLAQFETREKRYLEIIHQYDAQEQQKLAEAFGHLVMAAQKRQASGAFGDMLGSTFMMLDMGNSRTGQFFTPYEVSRLMGAMLMGSGHDLAAMAQKRGFIRLMEPACGAGGMVIAAAHALHEVGANYQQLMHATGIDIDRRCALMTFVQLALLHIPAHVVHGNALSGEHWEHWYTPAHIVGNWDARLRQREAVDAMHALLADGREGQQAPEQARAEAAPALPAQAAGAAKAAAAAGQMQLF